ncbi:TetR/AcrR family transcriptional regulator [Chitinophaga sancti]|uniref:TetR/AcrR family transcriptional regulator n=1 Tax=Chitinophaga sancti TaxID=1004 RepID=UPI002A75BEE8|nr:TetR/AcrR family transcriptional regulator [Chitinophaga sancti]WPQ62019.1 TetR/AcrR family transcriptional regulator [Chitinophaga sancti]
MKKAEATRINILQKAFELIYVKGYKATSVDDIIATTQVTKGAFYYHFKNKDEMGVAIINELMKPALTSSFIAPLEKEGSALDAIYNLMYHLLMKDEFMKVEYGCPVANLASEMCPWNEDFNNVLNEVTEQWTKLMIATVERGKKSGTIRKDVNAKQVTMFVMSGYWGVRNFGKLANSRSPYTLYLKQLKYYLDTLKA